MGNFHPLQAVGRGSEITTSSGLKFKLLVFNLVVTPALVRRHAYVGKEFCDQQAQ